MKRVLRCAVNQSGIATSIWGKIANDSGKNAIILWTQENTPIKLVALFWQKFRCAGYIWRSLKRALLHNIPCICCASKKFGYCWANLECRRQSLQESGHHQERCPLFPLVVPWDDRDSCSTTTSCICTCSPVPLCYLTDVQPDWGSPAIVPSLRLISPSAWVSKLSRSSTINEVNMTLSPKIRLDGEKVLDNLPSIDVDKDAGSSGPCSQDSKTFPCCESSLSTHAPPLCPCSFSIVRGGFS